MGLRSTYASILALAAAATAQKCPLIFDGRIPAGSTPALFDTAASPFNTDFVKGQNLTFSQLIKLPDVPASLFDTVGKTIPYEVTISDASIFAPSATNIQTGFRRAETMIKTNNGTDNSTLGLRTLHFSLRKDPARLFNLSHEYQLVFLEDAAFTTNQFVLKTGTIFGQAAGQDPDLLVLVGNVNANPVVNLFNASFTPGVTHNIGLTLDFNNNQVTVLYSTDASPLAVVNGPVANDLSGQGQLHYGALKKPTGEGIKDVTKEGFQPSGIDEGIIISGLFMEDSTGGCVSLDSGVGVGVGVGTGTATTGGAATTPPVDQCS